MSKPIYTGLWESRVISALHDTTRLPPFPVNLICLLCLYRLFVWNQCRPN